jgi:PAS domain S-box-containing protein
VAIQTPHGQPHRLSRSPGWRYGGAVVFTGLALALVVVLHPWLLHIAVAPFFAAVALSSWYGGFGPGLVSTGLSVLAISVEALPAVDRLRLNAYDLPILLMFVLVATLIAVLSGARDRAEVALASSEARFRTIVETANEGIWLLNRDGQTRYSNDRMARLLGLPGSSMATTSLWDFVVADDVPAAKEHLQRNRTGETEAFEFQFRRVDGQMVPVLAATSPLADDTGQVMGTIGVFTDISERAQAEAIQQAVTQAAAHDLRNPLTAIKAQSQLLRRRLEQGATVDRDRLVHGLRAIDASTSAMERLIDAMVDAARLRAGHQLTLQQQQTDLVALVTQAIDAAQQTTAAHRIFLETTVPVLVGAWDAPRLERVLSNVLSNAIKYSPQGGPISVGIACHETETTPWAVVTVADQGVGVPAADLPHVFERFHRGTNVGRIAGSGIGLAGAKVIVEQHGGMLDIESTEGVGTKVTLRLPVHPIPDASPSDSCPRNNGGA